MDTASTVGTVSFAFFYYISKAIDLLCFNCTCYILISNINLKYIIILWVHVRGLDKWYEYLENIVEWFKLLKNVK
jgi:hypothetical protein